MESLEDIAGESDAEKEKLAEMLLDEEGKRILAERLGKEPEEITYAEALALYRRNPSPLFFSKEIKLDEPNDEEAKWNKAVKETKEMNPDEKQEEESPFRRAA
jgi:hypothetical protein